MKKIGFVIPWYGEYISGGAEAALRGLVKNLHKSGLKVEVLSTCIKDFRSDWNENYHHPGLTVEGDIQVRRFKVRKRDTAAFDAVNAKLMKGMRPSSDEELIYINEIVNSPDLYKWLKEHNDDYSLFVFIPYMFGTTYYGMQVSPEKSVLLPCLHNESYIYMDIFKQLFPKIKGMVFHSLPEMQLAERVYALAKVKTANLGGGIDTDVKGNAQTFVDKYKVKEPFILYAGRKDIGKNVDLLLQYFERYKIEHSNDIKLVLLGGGSIDIPNSLKNEVFDLGFVPVQDKYDAYTAATLLCQPSTMESFSIVIMESWLCGRPVLVHADCPVTKNFAKESNGGLYFRTYGEFAGCVEYIINHPDVAVKMGELGCEYVVSNFSWDVIVKKYTEYFEQVSK